ncbi:MAG: LamG-like jellyroll fold domain-containing protein [Spirochaetota bacterium]
MKRILFTAMFSIAAYGDALHFPFNEKSGESAKDAGGITASVPDAWETGAFGGAVRLSGESADVVRIAVPREKQIGTGSMTIACWIYPDTFAIEAKDKRRRIFNIIDEWPNQYMVVEVKDNGSLGMSFGSRLADGKYSSGGVSAKLPIKTGTWTHIAFALDREAKRLRVYINGALDNEGALADTFTGDFRSDKPVTIGSSWQGFIGVVDEFRYFQSAVDAGALRTIYDSEKANYTGVLIVKAPAKNVPTVLPAERSGPPLIFYVSPSGADDAGGTAPDSDGKNGPFRTLAKAAAMLKAGDVLMLREGVYRETLEILRSGRPGEIIAVSNYNGEKAVISGADIIKGFERDDGNIHAVSVDLPLDDQNQIFAGGEMMIEARWPNTTNTFLHPVRAHMASGSVSNRIVDPDIPGGDDAWKGARIWCAGGAAWYFWNETVNGYDASQHAISFNAIKGHNDFYWPRKGNEYVLMGVRSALDSRGEWFYDRKAKRLFFWPMHDNDPSSIIIEAKKRILAVRVNASFVRIEGIAVHAGGMLITEASSNVVLKRLTGTFLGHSYDRDVSGTGAVVMRGSNIALVDSEFSLASGSLVSVYGIDNKVINCFIHDGNYAGKWGGAVTLAGRRVIFAHNTVCDAGRDIISVGGLTESIVEHNDLYRAGWLTHDLGMTYGHTTDFQNTVFRYNLVHDNMAAKTAMGIYFDHVTMNVIVHNNAVWNVGLDPLRINNPSYNCLVFNNTAYKAGDVGTFDHSKRNDLYGCRYYNNIVPKDMKLPKHVFTAGNISTAESDVKFRDAEGGDLTLMDGSPAFGKAFRDAGLGSDVGAFSAGTAWHAGHDFSKSAPRLSYEAPDVPYMNLVKNSCFEYGLEQWTKIGDGVKTSLGNGWGNGYGRGAPEPTGTCRGELELSGLSGVEQTVRGLFPDTEYTLYGWMKASPGETGTVSVRDHGGQTASSSVQATNWTRVFVEFRTGAATTAVIAIKKTSSGSGFVRADTFGLPKKPKGSSWERPPLDMSLGGAAKAAPIPPPFIAARVKIEPVIDGTIRAGEWPENAVRIEQNPNREFLGTAPASARICHDGETLFIAVTVPVKVDVKRGSTWGKDDGAEICFIDAKGAAPTASFVVHGFAGGGSESLASGGVSADAAKRLGDKVRYTARIEVNAWTGEWAIPFSPADIAANGGLKLAFNICVHRTETREWMLWVGSLGAAYQLENGGTIILE